MRADAERKRVEVMPVLHNNLLAGMDGDTTAVDDGAELLIAGAAEVGEMDDFWRAYRRSINYIVKSSLSHYKL